MVNGRGAHRTYAAPVARLSVQLGALTAAFVVGTALAGLLGAASLGIALSFGQIAFSLALGFVLLRA
jgi:hypothetical protein